MKKKKTNPTRNPVLCKPQQIPEWQIQGVREMTDEQIARLLYDYDQKIDQLMQAEEEIRTLKFIIWQIVKVSGGKVIVPDEIGKTHKNTFVTATRPLDKYEVCYEILTEFGFKEQP